MANISGGIGSNDTGTDLGPRITVMNTKGEVLARIGRESYGTRNPADSTPPTALAVDSKGDIYVAEVSWSDYGSVMDPPA